MPALQRGHESGNARTRIHGRPIRPGLNSGRPEAAVAMVPGSRVLVPGPKHLREAGESAVTAWFTLCGRSVPFPIEPTTCDIVVSMPEGLSRPSPGQGNGTLQRKRLAGRCRKASVLGRRHRAPGSCDSDVGNYFLIIGNYFLMIGNYFLIVDGDLNTCLLPGRLIAGRARILPRTYGACIAGNASGPPGNASGPPGTAAGPARASA